MDRSWLRTVKNSEFRDPTRFLVDLRRLEIEIAQSDTPARVKALRTNGLKEAKERRQAALFCHGMSMRLGRTVYFAVQENHDYDLVASWFIDDEQHFATVQLKEVVPHDLNPKASIDSVLASLEKYTDSADLTVAIHLNQSGHFDPALLRPPELKVASLWVFAAVAPDQSLWSLWGNFAEDDPYGTQFAYPTEV